MSSDTATHRHLDLLDEIAEAGMILIRRLHELPPHPRQDVARDFEILSRAVRRSILLFHLLEQDRLPHPKTPATPTAAGLPGAGSGDGGDRTRLDSIDTLDDVSGPFVAVVTGIVRDIQTALATAHVPADQADLCQEIAHRPLRPEADAADLE